MIVDEILEQEGKINIVDTVGIIYMGSGNWPLIFFNRLPHADAGGWLCRSVCFWEIHSVWGAGHHITSRACSRVVQKTKENGHTQVRTVDLHLWMPHL